MSNVVRIAVVGLLLFVAGGFLYTYANRHTYDSVGIGKSQYALEVSDTQERRIKGLSGRESLDQGTGMLFAYPEAGNECIWMKDMHFSLDILWLNADKKVIKIEKAVAPETYPRSFCASGTQYVIELNAGEATKAGVKVGQQIEF